MSNILITLRSTKENTIPEMMKQTYGKIWSLYYKNNLYLLITFLGIFFEINKTSVINQLKHKSTSKIHILTKYSNNKFKMFFLFFSLPLSVSETELKENGIGSTVPHSLVGDKPYMIGIEI